MQKLFASQCIIRKNELDSTNNYALKLINETELSNGTVVLASCQTKGRGQRENYWESESGKNLTISLILRPEFLPVHLQFAISKVISLGVSDFLSRYLQGVCIKWPNDIYVQDKKIAGILIEHTIMGSTLAYSICGIGLNINQKLFISNAPNPTSLSIETDQCYDLEVCLVELLGAIEKRYEQLQQGFIDELDKDYRKQMYRGDGFYKFSDEHGAFQAKIVGTTQVGQLILSTTEGEQRIYNFKEVSFIL